MKFTWEKEKDKAARYMKLPAKMKLKWLHDLNEFLLKLKPYNTKNTKAHPRKTH